MKGYVREKGVFVEVEVLTDFHCMRDSEKVLVQDVEGTLKIVNINGVYGKLPAVEDVEEVNILHKTIASLKRELEQANARYKEKVDKLDVDPFNTLLTEVEKLFGKKK